MQNKNVKGKKLTEEQMDALIEEATVDCHDDEECLTGFSTMIDDNLEFPFPAKVIGENVTVTETIEENNQIKAVCERAGKKYEVDIIDLKYDYSIVKGSEWIEAYREWNKGRY